MYCAPRAIGSGIVTDAPGFCPLGSSSHGYSNAIFDARTGATTNQFDVGSAKPCVTDYSGTSCPSERYSYDPAGRLASKVSASYKLDDLKQIEETDVTTTNAYDTENHIIDSSSDAFDFTSSTDVKRKEKMYLWRPDGHPVK
jgi:hypothetical protein